MDPNYKHVQFLPESANQQKPRAADNRARKAVESNMPKDSMKDSNSQPAKPKQHNYKGDSRRKAHDQVSKSDGQLVVTKPANPTRRDNSTKTEHLTKVVEKFKMSTKSEHSDIPGSTTSVSTLITVTRTTREGAGVQKNVEARNNNTKIGHHFDQTHAQFTNADHKPKKHRDHRDRSSNSINPSKPSAKDSHQNLPEKKSNPAKSKHNSATDPRRSALDKQSKPAKQLSQPKAPTKPTGKLKSGHQPESRSATSTTTTKEQTTYVHTYDNTKPGSINERKSENQLMITKPNFPAILASYPPSNKATPNQTIGLPNLNLANLPLSNFTLPQIAQLHNHPSLHGNPSSKGYLKVQVSTKKTTSQPSM